MKRPELFAIVVLTCIPRTAAAQVGDNVTPSAQRDAPTPRDEPTDSAPKAPTYTPAEIFGTSPPATLSSAADRNRTQVAQPLSAPSPSSVARSSRTTASPPPETSARTCSEPSDGPRATDLPPQASPFPGVSASQFRRAGVGTDAFTRPGVSTEQLRALLPGGESGPCRASRDVVLYPNPGNQRRVSPSTPVEP